MYIATCVSSMSLFCKLTSINLFETDTIDIMKYYRMPHLKFTFGKLENQVKSRKKSHNKYVNL